MHMQNDAHMTNFQYFNEYSFFMCSCDTHEWLSHFGMCTMASMYACIGVQILNLAIHVCNMLLYSHVQLIAMPRS